MSDKKAEGEYNYDCLANKSPLYSSPLVEDPAFFVRGGERIESHAALYENLNEGMCHEVTQ